VDRLLLAWEVEASAASYPVSRPTLTRLLHLGVYAFMLAWGGLEDPTSTARAMRISPLAAQGGRQKAEDVRPTLLDPIIKLLCPNRRARRPGDGPCTPGEPLSHRGAGLGRTTRNRDSIDRRVSDRVTHMTCSKHYRSSRGDLHTRSKGFAVCGPSR
jgi:hypothetical protein